jgi:hypothetical protein
MSLIKLFLGGNNLVFSRPERVWSVTSRLGTGKWLTLFYSAGTTQERVLYGILMDAGMVLSGREAKDYNRTHFKLQRKREERKSYSD